MYRLISVVGLVVMMLIAYGRHHCRHTGLISSRKENSKNE